MNFYQRMEILPLKKRVNRDKCIFATKQRMFGVFAIEEILCYRWTPFLGSRTLCHPAPKYDSVADVVEKLAAKRGQLIKVANRKNTKYVYVSCWPRIAWLWSHWVVLCYALIAPPAPHPPQNPFPSSQRGPVLVVWIMFGRVGADMALGHGWCTILLLLLGNNEKLPPVALDHCNAVWRKMVPHPQWSSLNNNMEQGFSHHVKHFEVIWNIL